MTQELANNTDLNKFLDCFMLVYCCTLLDNINLILQNYEVFETRKSRKMLGCLGLWAALICCYQKQGSIHDSCSIKHCSHENVVALFNKVDIVSTYNIYVISYSSSTNEKNI